MINKDKYEAITDFLKICLSDKCILKKEINNLNTVMKLVEMTLKKPFAYQKLKYQTKVDLNTSIDIIYNFFTEINPNYGNQFLNILRETIEDNKYFVEFEKSDKNSYVDGKGKVYIYYNETLDDTYSIMHEIIHKFSTQKNQTSSIKKLLGEIPTITFEYLLEDYLLKKTSFKKDEILINKYNSLIANTDKCLEVFTEYNLIKMYQKNEKINDEIINKHLSIFDKKDLEYQTLNELLEPVIDKILDKKYLSFIILNRYIIAYITGIYLKNKIEIDKNLEELFTLINILGKNDITKEEDIKIINNLNLPFTYEDNIKITDENIKILKKGYLREISNYKNL